MKSIRAFITSCLFLLLFATAAGAQMPGMRQGPQLRGLFNPVVGSGAQYQVQRGADDANKTTMEVDVVGKEAASGKDGYWLEVTAATNMGEMTMKMLTVADGANISVAKMVMQINGGPPMRCRSKWFAWASKIRPWTFAIEPTIWVRNRSRFRPAHFPRITIASRMARAISG